MKTHSSLPRAAALTLALCAGLASASLVYADTKPTPFTITSSDFRDGGKLGQKFAGNLKSNPNCDGQNISPALAWSNAPAATKSFVIFMVDPDGRNGLGVDHWVAYGIPASKTSLKEGEASAATPAIVGGTNTVGLNTYFGPCPPHNQRPHHYIINIVATDFDPGALRAGFTHEEMVAGLAGHVLGSTSIVATYAH
jgi:Raf kinase inhibitor-like YbhB/YbcL family protein